MNDIETYRARMQQLAIQKMLQLHTLDYTDYEAMIGFFEELQPATLAPAVRLDRLLIAYEFTSRGFIPSFGSTGVHDTSDPQVSGRILIGKALASMMKFGSIDVSFLAAAIEWRRTHAPQRS